MILLIKTIFTGQVMQKLLAERAFLMRPTVFCSFLLPRTIMSSFPLQPPLLPDTDTTERQVTKHCRALEEANSSELLLRNLQKFLMGDMSRPLHDSVHRLSLRRHTYPKEF
jgi:hypothetical protein